VEGQGRQNVGFGLLAHVVLGNAGGELDQNEALVGHVKDAEVTPGWMDPIPA